MSNLNKKNTSNKTKHLFVENEFKKLKTFDSIYFRGKNHFEENGMLNYLVFQPIKRYYKVIAVVIENFNVSSYLTLENCVFGSASLTKNADIDKYKYFGYGIGFDRHRNFSFPGTGLGGNVIIFGVEMSLSIKINNRKKDILILGKGPTQASEPTQCAEKIYSIIFTLKKKSKNFVWACIIIEKIVTFLLMALKLLNSNQKFLK